MRRLVYFEVDGSATLLWNWLPLLDQKQKCFGVDCSIIVSFTNSSKSLSCSYPNLFILNAIDKPLEGLGVDLNDS